LSDLAVLLTLLALPALTVRVLLLLAGLLAATLLLAGLLTRVLILLARILVLVGHSGSPFFALLGTQRDYNGEGLGLVSKKSRFQRDHCVAAACCNRDPGTGKFPVYGCLSRTPRCCRSGFPLLKNPATRRSGCRGHRRVRYARIPQKWAPVLR
jgi:hypothetical protein